MKKEILKAIKYFDYFDYAPTSEEIYKFLGKKTTKQSLLQELKKIILEGKSIKINDRYTVGGYGIKQVKSQKSSFDKLRMTLSEAEVLKVKSYSRRQQISQKKIKKIQIYIKILSFFPQIKLIGLSGTMAMLNADEGDDIDLFIITARNRLWTGRFIAAILAQSMGMRRKRCTTFRRPSESDKNEFRDKVCLNLFFDEKNLEVPDFKKTEYIVHEILQMKPLVSKDNVYERFLYANKWVYEIFPNVRSNFKCQSSNVKSSSKLKYLKFRFWILNFICHLSFVIWIFDSGENLLKKLQLRLINRHRSTEIISDTQLWFHPEDFEKKITEIE